MFWKIAARNLKLHFRRSLVTGLAIALGFVGVLLLGGYMIRMERYLSTQGIYLNHVGHIAIYKKSGLDRHLTDPEHYNLNQDDQNKILAAAHALKEQPEFIGSSLQGQGLVTNGCHSFPFIALGVDPQAELRARTHPAVVAQLSELVRLKKGSGFWETPSTGPDDRILVTYRLAKLLDKPLVAGDPAEDLQAMNALTTDCNAPHATGGIRSHSGVQLIGQSFSRGLAALDARIVGHFSTGLALADDSALLMPLSAAQRFFDTDAVTSMSLYLKPDAWTHSVLSDLRKSLPDYDLYSYRDDQVNPYFVGAMSFVYVMNAFFLFLVCTVVALSILNSLQITFLERKVEIGTLRAIGFRPERITDLFLREVFLLSLLSLTVGAVIAFSLSAWINSRAIRFGVPGIADDILFVLQPTALFTIIVGVIFIAVALGACIFNCNRRLRESVVSLLENT